MRRSEIGESFRIAVDSLRTNLMRSLLTTAGVVVGVVLVVLMGWTIKGLDAIWERTISIIGKDMIYIDKWSWAGGRNWMKDQYRKDITLEQIDLLQQRMESPESVIPVARAFGPITLGNTSVSTSVTGTRAEYGGTPAGTTTEGRFFSPAEDAEGTNVVVLGYTISTTLFPEGDAIGKSIKVRGIPFRVVGVIEKRGFLMMDFIDQQIFIPLTSFRACYGFAGRSFSAAIKAGNERIMDVVRDESIGLMRQIRNVPPGKEDDFSMNEMQALDDQIRSFRIFIWATGMSLTLLAFIVGSIGIMNIMFVSVTERTKEIGIRKAVGAKRSTILLQFLIESSMLCLGGAVVAFPIAQIIVGGLRWLAVNAFHFDAATAVSPLVPLDLLGIAIVVSIVVGLLAGLLPAMRASRLDPVEALRFE